MSTLPPSIIEQAVWMVKEIGIAVDQPTPHDYGRITSNLAMLKMNAINDDSFPAKWEALLMHLMYPDHNPAPEGLLRLPLAEFSHYDLALKALDDIYNKYGE